MSKTMMVRAHQPMIHAWFHYAVESAHSIDDVDTDWWMGEYERVSSRVMGWILDMELLFDGSDPDDADPTKAAARFFVRQIRGTVLEELICDGRYTPVYLTINSRDYYELEYTRRE